MHIRLQCLTPFGVLSLALSFCQGIGKGEVRQVPHVFPAILS